VHGVVTTTEQLTPGMVRIVLAGGDLDQLVMPDATDAYLNAAFPPQGAAYDAVFDPQMVRETHPKEQQPARRRYTVRSWDPTAHLLTVDFVVHGHEGVAGPWAAAARPGSVLVFTGPSGSYRPDPASDWHLMVGDESALPAIAASLESLESLAREARAVVRLVCDGPEHEVDLPICNADVQWLHRSGGPDDADLLVDAVRGLEFLPGRPFGFVHGEADEIRAVRHHLLHDRGLHRSDLSCSPYWRRTMTDEDWRRIKRSYVADMEAEEDR
jgi:NADPH-dependent ferric siderophore reductase